MRALNKIELSMFKTYKKSKMKRKKYSGFRSRNVAISFAEWGKEKNVDKFWHSEYA